MNIQTALDVSNRPISFREAEILLSQAISNDRTYLHTHPEQELTQYEQVTYETFLKQRENNEPVAYIIGQKEFYNRNFKCDKRALIPRPETEGLVELCLKYIKEGSNILEIGTGCGNIAITIQAETLHFSKRPRILATDISTEALDLAQENQESLLTDNLINFIQADLFDHPEIKKNAPYDLIVANLPYVPTTWMEHPDAQPEVIYKEPHIALFGGEDGLDLYRIFFQKVRDFVNKDSVIIVEYGEDETGDITPLVEKSLPESKYYVHKDYAKLDRVLEIII